MKTVFAVFLLALPMLPFAQTERFEVNGGSFVTKKVVEKNEWGTQDTLLYLYRVENNRPKYLLKHYLYQNEGGDCNNLYWAKGTYTQEGNRMLFITQHLQQRRDPIVEWEKQVYEVKPNGTVIPVEKMYRMTDSDEWLAEKE